MFQINRAALDALAPDDPKRAEVEALLAELDEVLEENPLQGFHPHAKQSVFMSSRDPVKAFLGGNRSGKTTAGIVDDLIQAVDKECLPERLRPFKRWEPPFYCRVIAPDFVSTMEGVIFQKLREWAPKNQLFKGSWEKAYDKQRRILRFANGSRFDFLTFEQDLDKHGGAALHRVHFDEEPPEPIRKEARARLIDYGGDELFTMTPLHGMTWMYDAVYERRDEPGVTVVQVATDENPHLDKASLEEFFASLSDEERKARREGRFVHFGGLVLFMFDDARHIVDEISPSHLEGQSVYVGIDPGIARGGVVWAAFDRDNHMIVFDELYPKDLTPEEIVPLIRERNKYWRINPTYIIDPSGRNRSGTDGEKVEGIYQRCGIYPVRGQNDRDTGVLQLRRRLEAGSLVVTRNCVNWAWEARRWRVSEDEVTSQEKKTGDTFATAGPDHLMDTTRYLAMERVWGAVNVPSLEKPKRWVPGEASPHLFDLLGQDVSSPPMGAMS